MKNKIHVLKIQPKYFKDVLNHRKNFEIRKDDRNYQVGDMIRLLEYENGAYTGREINNLLIEYILRDCPEYGLQEGYCILGFRTLIVDDDILTDDILIKASKGELLLKALSKVSDLESNECNTCDPNDDAVSRKAVLDIVKFEDKWLSAAKSNNANTDIAFNGIRVKVKNLPSITATQDWIPCSDKLPELDVNIGTLRKPIMVSKPVYISYHIPYLPEDCICPIPCYLHNNGHWYIDSDTLKEWVNLDDYDDGTDQPLQSEVTAWKPLPESYKEEEEKTKNDD